MANAQQLLEAAAQTLKSFGAKEVYVFGSAATGTLTDNSDIDLAVSGLPANVFFRAMAATRQAIQCEIDLVDLDEKTPFTEFLRQHGAIKRVA